VNTSAPPGAFQSCGCGRGTFGNKSLSAGIETQALLAAPGLLARAEDRLAQIVADLGMHSRCYDFWESYFPEIRRVEFAMDWSDPAKELRALFARFYNVPVLIGKDKTMNAKEIESGTGDGFPIRTDNVWKKPAGGKWRALP
jgi:hypothetical protein